MSELITDGGTLHLICDKLLLCDSEAEDAKYYCAPISWTPPGGGLHYPAWLKMPCSGTIEVSGLAANGTVAGCACADIEKTSPTAPAGGPTCSYQALLVESACSSDFKVSWEVNAQSTYNAGTGEYAIRIDGSYTIRYLAGNLLSVNYRKLDVFTGIDEDDCVCLDWPETVELDYHSTAVGGDASLPCGTPADKADTKLTFTAA